jgi:peroxiredoxin Q/BCP
MSHRIAVAVVIASSAWALPAASRIAAQEAAKPEKPVDLQVDDEAPEFEAVDQSGKEWKSKDHVGKKILVVYFYPKDMTPGCTKQGQCYRDAQADLEEEGVEVVGVSRDSVDSHQQFIKKEKLNFTLLSDPEGKVSAAFGVEPLKIGNLELNSRWTFVIDMDGKIAYRDDDVKADQDVKNVLKIVAGLKKKA